MPTITISLGASRFRVDTLDLPAAGKGQDASLAVDQFVGVADGSTPLLTTLPGSSVAQFSHTVLAALERHRRGTDVEMVRSALQDLGSPQHPVEESMSCTAALVRAHDTQLQAGVLGDCHVIARSTDGDIIAITDDRIEPYDERAATAFARLISSGTDESAAGAAITKMLLEHRQLANTPGAY